MKLDTTTVAPHWVTIAIWLRLSGMSRSGTYIALAQGNLVAIKPLGRRTLIDGAGGLAWLDAQPRLKFGKARA